MSAAVNGRVAPCVSVHAAPMRAGDASATSVASSDRARLVAARGRPVDSACPPPIRVPIALDGVRRVGLEPPVVERVGDVARSPADASGTSRRGRGRDRAGSSWSAPRTCSRADAPAPSGWTPWVTWGSWFGSPSRTIERAAPRHATTFASDCWPASSTKRTSTRPIDVRAGEQPRRPGRDVEASRRRSPSPIVGVRRLGHLGQVSGALVGLDPLEGPHAARRLREPPSTVSTSRFVIALWDWAGTPTRRPARTSSTIIRAPVQVLPVPGGPWMARTVLRRRHRESQAAAASSGGSPGSTSGAPAAMPSIRGGRPRSRSRIARYGPGPSSPSAMTVSATAAQRLAAGAWRRPARRAMQRLGRRDAALFGHA